MLVRESANFKRSGSAKRTFDIGGIQLHDTWKKNNLLLTIEVSKQTEYYNEKWLKELRELLIGKTISGIMARIVPESKKQPRTEIGDNVVTIISLKTTSSISPGFSMSSSRPRIIVTGDDNTEYLIDLKEKIYIK